jgi:hypothetical protein
MNYVYYAIGIVVLVAGLSAGGYFFYNQPSDVSVNGITAQVTGSSPATSTLDADQNQTLQRLNKLENIAIDAEFLDSEMFRSLENYGITIEQQSVGRQNPFRSPGVVSPADVSESSVDIDLFEENRTQQNTNNTQGNSGQSTTSVDALLEEDSGPANEDSETSGGQN